MDAGTNGSAEDEAVIATALRRAISIAPSEIHPSDVDESLLRDTVGQMRRDVDGEFFAQGRWAVSRADGGDLLIYYLVAS